MRGDSESALRRHRIELKIPGHSIRDSRDRTKH
jgi:hypothetical protein